MIPEIIKIDSPPGPEHEEAILSINDKPSAVERVLTHNANVCRNDREKIVVGSRLGTLFGEVFKRRLETLTGDIQKPSG